MKEWSKQKFTGSVKALRQENTCYSKTKNKLVCTRSLSLRRFVGNGRQGFDPGDPLHYVY